MGGDSEFCIKAHGGAAHWLPVSAMAARMRVRFVFTQGVRAGCTNAPRIIARLPAVPIAQLAPFLQVASN
jgi:hypothetical protein